MSRTSALNTPLVCRRPLIGGLRHGIPDEPSYSSYTFVFLLQGMYTSNPGYLDWQSLDP